MSYQKTFQNFIRDKNLTTGELRTLRSMQSSKNVPEFNKHIETLTRRHNLKIEGEKYSPDRVTEATGYAPNFQKLEKDWKKKQKDIMQDASHQKGEKVGDFNWSDWIESDEGRKVIEAVRRGENPGNLQVNVEREGYGSGRPGEGDDGAYSLTFASKYQQKTGGKSDGDETYGDTSIVQEFNTEVPKWKMEHLESPELDAMEAKYSIDKRAAENDRIEKNAPELPTLKELGFNPNLKANPQKSFKVPKIPGLDSSINRAKNKIKKLSEFKPDKYKVITSKDVLIMPAKGTKEQKQRNQKRKRYQAKVLKAYAGKGMGVLKPKYLKNTKMLDKQEKLSKAFTSPFNQQQPVGKGVLTRKEFKKQKKKGTPERTVVRPAPKRPLDPFRKEKNLIKIGRL